MKLQSTHLLCLLLLNSAFPPPTIFAETSVLTPGFKAGISPTPKKESTPKLTSKDVRELPFCATEPKTKYDPKEKGIFDELKVTVSDRIHIHGKKKWDAGRVKGNILYQLGKAALFPVAERSGSLIAKEPTESGVRRHFAVLETAEGLIPKEITLSSGKSYAWVLTTDGSETVLTVTEDGQLIGKVSGPAASITGCGFAAAVRWVGNEVDLVVTFDDNKK